ncbi:MAG: bacteriohemerythrin [Nevskiales bacterium]|nr:bacteriohemerythrin [Nevskiales bacterium]
MNAPAHAVHAKTADAAVPHAHVPLIAWTPELSVGIEEIDSQHKTLVDLLNQLHVAIVERHGARDAAEILERLVDYTRIHFAVEEALMRMLDYPDYEAHKAEHEELVEQVYQLRRKVMVEGKPITGELLFFLKRWLTEHILASDQKYAPHLLSRGVRAQYAKPSWLQRLWARSSH